MGEGGSGWVVITCQSTRLGIHSWETVHVRLCSRGCTASPQRQARNALTNMVAQAQGEGGLGAGHSVGERVERRYYVGEAERARHDEDFRRPKSCKVRRDASGISRRMN